MGFSAAAVIGLVGTAVSADAAHGAANAQEAAGNKAIAAQQQALTQQQALQEPFRTAGMTALDRLVAGTQAGGEFAKPFSMAESPAQQFATKEALAAMQSQMQTGGQALSSNAISGAGKLAADIGSQYEAQAYNQWLTSQQQAMAPLQFLASQGQAAASGQAANIGGATNNITGLQTGIGNVQAAGTVAGGNAMGGAMNSVSQYMMLQSLLGGGSGGGSGGVGSITGGMSDYTGGYTAASDPLVKENITRIGETVHGLGLYTWNYVWDRTRKYSGVLSTEVEKVMPEAVIKGDLFDSVDYQMLGIKMEQV